MQPAAGRLLLLLLLAQPAGLVRLCCPETVLPALLQAVCSWQGLPVALLHDAGQRKGEVG